MSQLVVNFINKPAKGVMTFFNRMKLFYQIFIIILLMAIFLVIQGYLGLRIINNMQEATQQTFNNSFQSTESINLIKNGLLKLRVNYLEEIVTKSVIMSDLDSILNTVQTLKAVDHNTAEQVENELKTIEVILDEPRNDTNYKKLVKRLFAADPYLDTIETAVKSNALSLMGYGNEFSANSRRNTLIILIIGMLISVGAGLMIAVSIARPLRGIVKAANFLATGDLSQEIKARGCYETISAVNGLNRAVAGLRDLVLGINDDAELLVKSSLELRNAANDSGKSATEVARAMAEVANASSEQTTHINQTVEKINMLAGLVKEVSDDTEKIAAASQQMADSAQLGQKATTDVTNEFQELFNFTQDAELAFNELRNSSGEIFEILGMIRGIAEQTSLLALNAAIEAARAGKHGKGFSVVAKETGKLADQSKQAAELITDLITQMKNRIEQAVKVMEDGVAKAKNGQIIAAEVTTTFEGIFQALHQNLNEVGTMAKSAKQMESNNEGVITAVTTIAAISEETLASTEEVSATSEEQSALAQQVTALAGNLDQVANQMKRLVSAFKV
jgi:methyl-accepting chemotaxis protein